MTFPAMERISWLLAAFFGATGCAHERLSSGDLNRVLRPAFVSRMEEGAGPKSQVFSEDNSYRVKLGAIEPGEADRRLRAKLTEAVSPFEVSDRLRAVTVANLPKERPWSQIVDSLAVAGALESLVVREVPAKPPEYDRLRRLGADSVVEFVVQEYGMRSEKGHAGAYAKGFGRMFFLDGGEIWRSSFNEDQINRREPPLDPFEVVKKPELFRDALSGLLDRAAGEFAARLTPPERRFQPSKPDTPGDTPPVPR